MSATAILARADECGQGWGGAQPGPGATRDYWMRYD
jgi:hypothetical protein